MPAPSRAARDRAGGILTRGDSAHGLASNQGLSRHHPGDRPRVWLDDVGRKRFEKTLADFEEDRVIARLWAGDASLWKSGPKPDQVTANALGWLTVIDKVRPHAGDLKRFGGEVAGPGFSHVVFMGVNGPSLCSEALRRTRPRIAAHPELIVLDSTVPASVHRLEGRIDPTHTLFVVACKTGTTVEPAAFFDYPFEIVWRSKGDNAGENFIAITNRGTPMEAKARRDVFRRTFLNPDGVVGRYSALSYCGMVPAALMGLDVIALLDRAGIAARACRPETPIGENPGAVLGAALDTLAWLGRDKLTLVVPPPLEALALWIEQLVAGSTGKQGRGIIPVVGEPLDRPGVFGGDRVFVQVRTPDRPGVEDHSAAEGARRCRPPRHRPGPGRPARPGRRVLSLGVRHRVGRASARGQPVRPARRPGEPGQRPGVAPRVSEER